MIYTSARAGCSGLSEASLGATVQELLTSGVVFPESPRWHQGRLWFSDVYDFALKAVDMSGRVEIVAAVPGRPSGLGVLPDGRMLMATGVERTLYSVASGGGMALVADLSGRAGGLLNDMVVDVYGRAYVGDTGFNPASGEPFQPGRTWLVVPGSEPEVAADDIHLPNGCAISDDGRMLFLAETFANRISRFSVDENGRLSGRAIHAELSSRPDGLCLDAEGALWVAMVQEGAFIRIDPRGAVVDRLPSASPFALACAFGGPERNLLFLTSADTTLERLRVGDSVGRIDYVCAHVRGSGRP
jgi:sugar lactone lactonase YvrE